MDDLKQKTSRALKWRFATVIGHVAMQLIVTCVLARLLPIEAFGLIGQAMIFIGLVTVFSEIGMAPVLIQREKITSEDIAHAYTISFLLGCIWACSLYFSAPLIASWFESPALIQILQTLSAMFLFSGLTLTTLATLQRELNFQRIFWIELCSYVIGYGVVGIAAALNGAGVWALVYALITQSVLQLFTALLLAGRVPKFGFRWSAVKSLLGQGSGFSAARMVLFAARNIDALLIGKFLGTEALGLYSRSYQLTTAPIKKFSGVLNSVFFPAYSRIQSDRPRLKKLFLENLSSVVLLLFPALAFLAVCGREVVTVLLGEKWEAAIVPFQLLCIGAIPLCALNICETLARSCGDIRGRLIRHGIYLAGMSLVVISLSSYGLPAVAMGVSGWLVVQWLLMGHLATGLLKCKWSEFLAAHAQGVTFAIAVTLATLGLRTLLVAPWVMTSNILILAVLFIVIVPTCLLSVAVLPARLLPGPVCEIRTEIKSFLLRSNKKQEPKPNTKPKVISQDKLNAA